MSTTDLNTIAENLAELLTTVTSQTNAFYKLFLDTTPQDVTFLAFDSNNQLVEVTIPNRAKDRQIATSGNGSPEGVVTGNVGEAYVDQQYNQIYYKISGSGNTGWTLALTQASVEALLQSYVPKTRTVNNKMLSEDITLTASDINAMASTEKLGKSLEISGINLTLKDQDGVALSSVPIVTTGANKDLSNLTSTGEAHFQAPVTGGATTITTSNLTASRALVSDSNGKVAVSAITSTELGYIDGVTSNIQTQLNAKLATATYNNNPRIAGIYLKTAFVNGTSGYNIWSNGYCEQWGRITVGSRSSAQVTLTKTYSDLNYKAIACGIGSMNMGAHDPQNAQVQSIDSASTFTVCNGETQRTVQWETGGYLASGQY